MRTQFELSRSKLLKSVLICCPVIALVGCTAIPLKRLQPLADPPSLTCSNPKDVTRLLGEPSDNSFHYVLVSGNGASSFFTASVSDTEPARFEAYRGQVLQDVQAKLPDNLKNHSVTLKLTEFLTAVSGQAQLNAGITEKVITDKRAAIEQSSIQRHSKGP